MVSVNFCYGFFFIPVVVVVVGGGIVDCAAFDEPSKKRTQKNHLTTFDTISDPNRINVDRR